MRDDELDVAPHARGRARIDLPGSMPLDGPALGMWRNVFLLRYAFLAVAGVTALSVAWGPDGWVMAGAMWLVVVPYNWWLWNRTRRDGHVPALMAAGDQGLCVAFGVALAWALPVAAIAAIIDLAIAAQVFSRRVVLRAAAVSSVGFLAATVLHPGLLAEAWAVVTAAIFPISAVSVVISVGSVTHRERDTARRFTALAEGLDAIVWRRSPDGLITYMSQRAEELLGHRAELHTPEAAYWAAVVHPDDRARVAAIQRQALADGAGYEWTARTCALDGTERVLRVLVASAAQGGGRSGQLHGLAVDVTEEHRARRALQDRTREQLAVLELAQLAAGDVDLDALYQHAADVVGDVMGADLAQVSIYEAQDLLELRAGRGWDAAVGTRRQAVYPAGEVSGTASALDDPLLVDHGVRSSAWVAMGTKDRFGILGVHHRDERRLSDDNLVFLHAVAQVLTTARGRHLIEQQALRSQSLEVLGRFASGIAHDFNNLLMTVLGSVELMRLEEVSVAATDRLDAIERAGRSAAELCQQLVALARGEQVGSTSVDLAELILETMPLVERLVGAGVSVQFRGDGGHLVDSNAAQLQQVLLNLAANARDAMPEGGQLLIDLEAADGATDPVVTLTVTDTGHGMDATTLQRARDLFFTTKSTGSGLGLGTVETIVHNNGGRMSLTSEPGRGTTVRIELPTTSKPVAAQAGPGAPGSQPSPALTVLVVDDQAMVATVVAQALAGSGHHVHQAADMRQAIALASELTQLDLLITDMVMPSGDGHQVAAAIRTSRPGLPVIYMSGYSDTVPEEEGLHLQKPFTVLALLDAVHRATSADPLAVRTGSR